MLQGVSAGSGMRAIMAALGVFVSVKCKTDSSAAKGIAGRRGIGKTRHVDVCFLWLQEKVAAREVTVQQIPGDCNPADLMTKLFGKRSH